MPDTWIEFRLECGHVMRRPGRIVGDRVVFSLGPSPCPECPGHPVRHLVNLVDWKR